MQIELKLDDSCTEPRLIIVTDKMTDEINLLLKKLADDPPRIIAGFSEGAVTILEPEKIIRVLRRSRQGFRLCGRRRVPGASAALRT